MTRGLLEGTRLLARLTAVAVLLLAAAPLHAQLAPPSTGGSATYERELRFLGANKRVLVVAAHPDDEDTELLALLARGWGAEAAYLSLTRGDGGQNLLGPELGVPLGLLRSEELLAARRLDGARQYFTRALDGGFSKTLDDTWASWPRDSILKDVVRIVRRFRPQVMVAIFSGTPRDGHGQHQAAGWAAREAFRVAGDPAVFPELAREEGLAPWAPAKLYRSARFDTASTTTTLDGGRLDPVEGQNYRQLAMRSRSLHRSQDMGRLQALDGPPIRIGLIDDRVRGGQPLFAGIDTTLVPELGAARATALRLVLDSVRREPRPLEGARAGDLLARAVALLRGDALVAREQRAHAERALAVARGLVIDARAEEADLVPGSRVGVTVELWNAGSAPIALSARLVGPLARGAAPVVEGTLAPGERRLVRTELVVPADASPTTPYFLRRAPGAVYDWRDATPEERGLPFEAPPLELAVTLGTGDAASAITREVSFRGNEQASGEFRKPLRVAPAVEVALERALEVIPLGEGAPRPVAVVLTQRAATPQAGEVRLVVPAGWPAPAPQHFELTRRGAHARLVFEVAAPARVAAGRYRVHAEAEVGGAVQTVSLASVEYPHIRARTWTVPAEGAIVVTPLTAPLARRIGYVRGASDRVPEALAAAGIDVHLLDGRELASGDLARYDAIVVGPRAYETDSALAGSNDRLLAWARAGGLLVVQYQQYPYVQGRFAPFPFAMAVPHDRVTEEGAAVRLLDPAHPLFTAPNAITATDWDGWVQERGLYFARTWDAAYRPLLESHDTGEPPQQGGLLVAPLGKGTFVYAALSFFRELPAGVPGAFRLFANLLSLLPTPRPGV